MSGLELTLYLKSIRMVDCLWMAFVLDETRRCGPRLSLHKRPFVACLLTNPHDYACIFWDIETSSYSTISGDRLILLNTFHSTVVRFYARLLDRIVGNKERMRYTSLMVSKHIQSREIYMSNPRGKGFHCVTKHNECEKNDKNSLYYGNWGPRRPEQRWKKSMTGTD